MTELLTSAYDYLDELRNDSLYIEYIKLFKLIETKYQENILSFNQVKDKYDEVMAYGTYHPDFKIVSKQYVEAKISLFKIVEIKRYFELDNIIEEKVNQALKEVASEISSNIKVFEKFSFSKKGGSCSGCK